MRVCVCLQGRGRTGGQLFVLAYNNFSKKGNKYVLLGQLCYNTANLSSHWEVESLLLQFFDVSENYIKIKLDTSGNSEISSISQTKSPFTDFFIFYINMRWRNCVDHSSLCCHRGHTQVSQHHLGPEQQEAAVFSALIIITSSCEKKNPYHCHLIATGCALTSINMTFLFQFLYNCEAGVNYTVNSLCFISMVQGYPKWMAINLLNINMVIKVTINWFIYTNISKEQDKQWIIINGNSTSGSK